MRGPIAKRALEDEARKHLREWAGIEFDPRVVRAFLSLHQFPELKSYAKKEESPDSGIWSQESETGSTSLTPDSGL